MAIVWPSGAALAAAARPILPLAPPLLSTTMFQPVAACIFSARPRVSTSVPPPAGNGTITVIGREGHLACAKRILGNANVSAVAPVAAQNDRRFIRFIKSSSAGYRDSL